MFGAPVTRVSNPSKSNPGQRNHCLADPSLYAQSASGKFPYVHSEVYLAQKRLTIENAMMMPRFQVLAFSALPPWSAFSGVRFSGMKILLPGSPFPQRGLVRVFQHRQGNLTGHVQSNAAPYTMTGLLSLRP